MFTLELLQAINDWQISANPRRAERLKSLAADLPPRLRETPLCCFRQISLSTDFVEKLGEELHLVEKISAWTLTTDVAKHFKGGVPPEGLQGVIFEFVPATENAVINLVAVFADPEFREACERLGSAVVRFGDGIGRYGASQAEIVLDIPILPIAAIYALGGHSSSPAAIARAYFGHEPSPAEWAYFEYLITHSTKRPGPNWVTGNAKDRVLHKFLEVVDTRRDNPRLTPAELNAAADANARAGGRG